MPIKSLLKRGIEFRRRMSFISATNADYQEKTLRRLLNKAAYTAFGTHYNFKAILKAEDIFAAYSEALPIFDYDKIYKEWWYRCLNNESNICWVGKVPYFALSSGTSGAPSKYIPVTEDMLRTMRTASTKAFFNVATFDQVDMSLFRGCMLMLGSTTTLSQKGDYLVGDLSGINASRVPAWFQGYYKPGKKIAALPNYESRIAAIAEEARDWDITALSGIPSWVLLMLEKVVERHNLKNIHEIWPNLQAYASGGIAFEPYRKDFERLLGRPIVVFDTYLASEGFFAFQNRENDQHAMALILNSGIYFEFIPFDDDNFNSEGDLLPNPKALNIEQVQENKDYAMVISTCAGAWRYLIGDVVRFTDIKRCEIIITGRTKHFLSVCGEHLSVDNMNRGIQAVEETFDIPIREFTVGVVKRGNQFAHRWYIACENPAIKAEQVAIILDDELRKLNDDYATERGQKVLEMEVRLIPSHLFYDWFAAQGKLGGQVKFPRVMKKERFAEWEMFINATQTTY